MCKISKDIGKIEDIVPRAKKMKICPIFVVVSTKDLFGQSKNLFQLDFFVALTKNFVSQLKDWFAHIKIRICGWI